MYSTRETNDLRWNEWTFEFSRYKNRISDRMNHVNEEIHRIEREQQHRSIIDLVDGELDVEIVYNHRNKCTWNEEIHLEYAFPFHVRVEPFEFVIRNRYDYVLNVFEGRINVLDEFSMLDFRCLREIVSELETKNKDSRVKDKRIIYWFLWKHFHRPMFLFVRSEKRSTEMLIDWNSNWSDLTLQ